MPFLIAAFAVLVLLGIAEAVRTARRDWRIYEDAREQQPVRRPGNDRN